MYVNANPERKPPGIEVEDDEFAMTGEDNISQAVPERLYLEDDLPHQGSATIECDGSGGYRVNLGWAATARCGIRDCVRRHEESHITDWRGRWPNGCRNADGTNKPAGSQVPTGGDGYDAFLRQSECRAYNIEVPCEEALLRNASEDCRDYVRNILGDSRNQQRSYC